MGAIVAGVAAVGSPPPLALKVAGGGAARDLPRRGWGVHGLRRRARRGSRPASSRRGTDRERLGGRLLVVRLGRGDALLVRAPLGRLGRGLLHRRRQRRGDRRRRPATAPAAPRVGMRGGAGAAVQLGADVGVRELRGRPRAFVRRWARARSRSAARRGGSCAGGLPVLSPPPFAADAGARRDLPRGRGVRRESRRRSVGARAAGARAATRRGEAGLILGRRVAPRRARDLVRPGRLRERAGRLGAVLGAGPGAGGGRGGRSRSRRCTTGPVELRLRTAARWHGDGDLAGPASSL